MNVLLTSSGRRVALVRAFRQELERLWPGARVYTTDLSRMSAAFHAAHAGILMPPCDDAGYVPALLDVVRRREIGVVVPLIDTELPVLAPHRADFLAAGCHLVISDPEAVETTRHKGMTARRFRELGFRTPHVFEADALEDPNGIAYPVFLKPAAGSGSIDAVRVDGAEELRFWLRRVKAPVVQSFERGQEYTIDVFADLEGRARCAVPRQRWEIRAGEISKGCTTKNWKLMDAAKRLVEQLGGCRGCITIQCFDPGGTDEPIFFEANLRFGGGFPLSYAAGANYPRWVLEMCAGNPIATFDDWRDGLVMLRYDDALYLESLG
jgi:carbamoyl-phosphate synthase large subunit